MIFFTPFCLAANCQQRSEPRPLGRRARLSPTPTTCLFSIGSLEPPGRSRHGSGSTWPCQRKHSAIELRMAAESLDDVSAENRYRLEPAEKGTPESLFERGWGLTLIRLTRGSRRWTSSLRLTGSLSTPSPPLIVSGARRSFSSASPPIRFDLPETGPKPPQWPGHCSAECLSAFAVPAAMIV